MSARDQDTIVASASPAGRGAVSLIRLSGPAAQAVVARLCPGGPPWVARRASVRVCRGEDGVLDEALVVWMPGPRSYTGETVVEIACHGNPVVVDAIIDRCVALGARPADPGEFTRRALVRGRIDLLQAEGVDALIRARTLGGVRAARTGLDGELSLVVDNLRHRLLDLGAELEARLDHPGEGLGEADDADVSAALRALAQDLHRLAGTWTSARRRIEGAVVALVGDVNAGKSSLFNQLVGSERALVSSRPGTTRDAVERTVEWDGVSVTFVDTAGLRQADDQIEAAGIALGARLAASADLQLRVFHPGLGDAPPGDGWAVATHRDLCAPSESPPAADHWVSSTTGAGIEALRSALRAWVVGVDPAGEAVLGSRRQHDLLVRVAAHVSEAADALDGFVGPVVAAEEVTAALERLGALRGDDVREDILDRLFSRFCIGK